MSKINGEVSKKRSKSITLMPGMLPFKIREAYGPYGCYVVEAQQNE